MCWHHQIPQICRFISITRFLRVIFFKLTNFIRLKFIKFTNFTKFRFAGFFGFTKSIQFFLFVGTIRSGWLFCLTVWSQGKQQPMRGENPIIKRKPMRGQNPSNVVFIIIGWLTGWLFDWLAGWLSSSSLSSFRENHWKGKLKLLSSLSSHFSKASKAHKASTKGIYFHGSQWFPVSSSAELTQGFSISKIQESNCHKP